MKKLLILFILLFLNSTLLAKNEITHQINVDNISISEFIKLSSKILNKNIILTQKIEGEVDFISHKPISNNELYSILKATLSTKGYEIVHIDDILKIVKFEDKKKNIKDKDDNIVEIINLYNIDVNNITPIIETMYNIKENKIFIAQDVHSNSLILKAKRNDIKQIKALVKKLDIDQMQVYVEAKIIELSENKTKELGARYSLSSIDASSSNIFTLGANLGGSVNALDQATSSLFTLSTKSLSSAVALGATLNLLKENQVIDIVSEPSVLGLNNKISTIYVGETRSFQTSNTITDGGNTNNTFQREDIGLTLKVKPRISTENKVVLEIEAILEDAKELRVSQINPDTTKKEIKTTAIVENAQSVILGGLIKSKTDQQNSQVPVLADLPIFGNLFKYNRKVDDKINLVVIVTPYIVPKSKDLSFVKEQLASLKKLEENYAKELKKILTNNSFKDNSKNLNHQDILSSYYDSN